MLVLPKVLEAFVAPGPLWLSPEVGEEKVGLN